MNEVQAMVLDYYRECITRGGGVPSQEQVADKFSISTPRVNRVIGQLEELGYLRRTRGKHRAIELAGMVSLATVPTDRLRAELARRGITFDGLDGGEPVKFRRGGASCAADSCQLEVERGKLFCRRHWFSLPEPLRKAIWRAFIGKNVTRYQELVTEARDRIDSGLYREPRWGGQ